MRDWPLLNRNKIEDSHIEEPVQTCACSEDTELKSLAKSVSVAFSFLLHPSN